MADATQTTEVIARSFVPEGTPRPPALTPEQQRSQDVADNLRQRLEAKPEDPLAALKPVEERQPLSVDLDKELNRRFGIEGAPRTVDEQTRFDEAKTLGDTRKLLAERGYESLTPDQQNELITSLITGTLDRRPAFRGLANEEKVAIATNILLNSAYEKKIGEMLASGFSPDEVIEVSQPLIEAQTAFDEALAAFHGKQTEARTTLIDRLTVQGHLDEFNPTTASGTRGAKFEELERLRADEALNREMIDESIADLKARGKSDADIDAMKAQVREKIARGEAITDPDELMISGVLDIQSDIDRIGELEIEHADLDTERNRLNQRLLELPNEITELNNTRSEKENELVDARNKKMLQEQSVIENMRRVASNAGNEVLDEEIQERATEYQSQLNEKLAQVKDADEKKILEKKKARWDRAEIRGDNIRFTIKKNVVNRDIRTMLIGDGPEAIVKEMLLDGVRDPQERARIEERLKTDQVFVKKWSEDIAATVVTKKLQSGRLYEGEIRVMLDMPWGQGAIDQAIANDAAKRKAIEKIHADPNNPSYVDRIKRAAGSNWLKFLMLFLLGGVAAGAITTKLVAQEGRR